MAWKRATRKAAQAAFDAGHPIALCLDGQRCAGFTARRVRRVADHGTFGEMVESYSATYGAPYYYRETE